MDITIIHLKTCNIYLTLNERSEIAKVSINESYEDKRLITMLITPFLSHIICFFCIYFKLIKLQSSVLKHFLMQSYGTYLIIYLVFYTFLF